MLSLELPIFNGVARANYAAVSASVALLEATKTTIEQQVLSEVALALGQYERVGRRLRGAGLAAQAAHDNLLAALRKQKLGLSSTYEVTRVQDEVTSAELSLASGRAELGRASANLWFALGRGREAVHLRERAP